MVLETENSDAMKDKEKAQLGKAEKVWWCGVNQVKGAEGDAMPGGAG
jgi:hypothetical protein